MHDIFGIILNAGVYAPFVAAIIMIAFWQFISNGLAKFLSVLSALILATSGVVIWAFASVNDSMLQYLLAESSVDSILPTFALNGVSLPMYLLAGLVGLAATLQASNAKIKNVKLFYFLLMIMLGGLAGAFASVNVVWIYAFHEFALVPTFIAMVLWGSAGGRLAAMQMAIYLTIGALVSLIGIIAIYSQSGAESFGLREILIAVSSAPLSAQWQYVIFGLLLFGLGTLVSLFPFYSWAPRTYATAPTAFAMLHAGVLKKFGLYLLIQLALVALPLGVSAWSQTMAVLALVNIVFIGLVTMAQRDLKMMVSYSSVAHMGVCFLGIATMSILGVGASIIFMFGHGLSVALMLMLSTAVVNRTGEWEMKKMGGLYKQTPVLASFFLAGTFASLGLPCFANFWGELGVFVALWDFSPVVCAIAATGIIISAIYGLRAFAAVFMGEPSETFAPRFSEVADLTLKEKIPALILVVALVFVGFYPKSITADINSFFNAPSVQSTQTK